MEIDCIQNFGDFARVLRRVGFSVSGGSAEGGIALSDAFSPDVRWFSGAETDPWEWRMRVVEELKDVAYAKVFLGKGGFITREWYPYFLAVRRGGMTFDDLYQDGLLSAFARDIYRAIEEHGQIAYHEIKRVIGSGREDESKVKTALVQLQMRMLVTIAGRTYRYNKEGLPYGWEVNVFSTPEHYFGDGVFEESIGVGRDAAIAAIAGRIRECRPDTGEREMMKFIRV